MLTKFSDCGYIVSMWDDLQLVIVRHISSTVLVVRSKTAFQISQSATDHKDGDQSLRLAFLDYTDYAEGPKWQAIWEKRGAGKGRVYPACV
jgi:hypothetical protein